jgi:hypothetical protein
MRPMRRLSNTAPSAELLSPADSALNVAARTEVPLKQLDNLLHCSWLYAMLTGGSRGAVR